MGKRGSGAGLGREVGRRMFFGGKVAGGDHFLKNVQKSACIAVNYFA